MASFSGDVEDFPSSDSDSDGDAEEMVECANICLSATALNLKEVMSKIQQDETVLNCSLGESICNAAKKCELHIATPEMQNFAATAVRELEQILCCDKTKAKKKRIKLSHFWRQFHIFRLSSTVNKAWQSCAASLDIADSIKSLTLQVILKQMITNIISHRVKTTDTSIQVERMTEREENVVRHMAGYVAFKIKKKFPLHSDLLELESGVTLDFTGDDLQDYTKVWTKQIDRGGLHHVNDTFYNFSVAVEYKCRKYLDTRLTPGNDLVSKIKEDCLKSEHIEKLWKEISIPSSSASSKKSEEILFYIIRLWTNIRVHSFAKKWSAELLAKAKSQSHTKSVRKTLKRKGTEKESN